MGLSSAMMRVNKEVSAPPLLVYARRARADVSKSGLPSMAMSARLGAAQPMATSAARCSAFVGASPARLVAARPAAGNACRTVVTMAKKGKDVRLMITLECTEQKATGVSGISRYTSEKARASPGARARLGFLGQRWLARLPRRTCPAGGSAALHAATRSGTARGAQAPRAEKPCMPSNAPR